MGQIKVPQGKQVRIYRDGQDIMNNDDIASGLKLTLEEEATINLSANFGTLFSGDSGDLAALFSGVARDLGFNASAQFKEFGFQFFKNSDPAVINLNLNFYLGKADAFDGFSEVVAPMRALGNLCLPQEGGVANTLILPGPSLFALLKDNTEVNIASETISLQIGEVIRFPSVIIKRAEPTYSNEVDDNGNPIAGKIAIEFNSLYNATANLLATNQTDFNNKAGVANEPSGTTEITQ